MIAYVYSVLGQTEGRKKAFMKCKSINVSYKLSLTCGGNINYVSNVNYVNIKSVHHPFHTHENREQPKMFKINK